ncbi:MAG: hypothetical protein EBV03_06235 [Proteobacteria bacterium]|nr:hypothetical protein [Pseudomonadota bacterium]
MQHMAIEREQPPETLETNFWELGKYLKEGKPLLLYLLGQSWSMILSLIMAYIMFGVLYADKIKAFLAK